MKFPLTSALPYFVKIETLKQHYQLLEFLKKQLPKIVSIDIETDARNKPLLTNERLLAIGASRLIDGKLRTKLFISRGTNDKDEEKLLKDFSKYLERVKPIALVGYGIRGYDTPLLVMKNRYYFGSKAVMNKRKHSRSKKAESVALLDTLTSAMLIDLASYFGYMGLKEIVSEMKERVRELKVPRSYLAIEEGDKAAKIFQMWKKDRKSFKKYLRLDVENPLHLFKWLLSDDLWASIR